MNKIIERGRDMFSPNITPIESTAWRRKRIYKGKVAPQGTIFLVLDVKVKGMKYTQVEHIPGGQSKELEAEIQKQMLENLCAKFNLKP